MGAQFHLNPETYLDEIRAEIPRYDELQRAAVEAIPFPPERVLELGMGTGETTRVLLEAYPDAWVIGLDSSSEMVFKLRQEYDDVQLARMEDPLPDGPWAPETQMPLMFVGALLGQTSSPFRTFFLSFFLAIVLFLIDLPLIFFAA